MVSIEKNNERRSLCTFDCSGHDRVRGLMSVHEFCWHNGGLLSNVLFRQAQQIAMNVPILFEVIFTNDFPINIKSIHTVTSSNIVKPFNGQLAFRREVVAFVFGRSLRLLPLWRTFSCLVYTSA